MLHPNPPINEEITTMFNSLSPILLNIPYDYTDAKHNMIGFIASCAAYVVRFNFSLPRLDHTGAYNPDIRKSATVFDLSHSEGKWSDLKADNALLEST